MTDCPCVQYCVIFKCSPSFYVSYMLEDSYAVL